MRIAPCIFTCRHRLFLSQAAKDGLCGGENIGIESFEVKRIINPLPLTNLICEPDGLERKFLAQQVPLGCNQHDKSQFCFFHI